MAYLRHHGFPSPLLDWSASPFVAAYFAFREPREEDIAIFAFRDRGPGGMKIGGSAIAGTLPRYSYGAFLCAAHRLAENTEKADSKSVPSTVA